MSATEPTRSPRRQLIMASVKKKAMTAAQIGELIGVTRECAYNILSKMALSNQVTKINRASQVFWRGYKAPPPVVRTTPHINSTMRAPLSTSYMQAPYRAGAMDAFDISSRGVG